MDPHGVDLSTITRAERWIFGFGLALFVNAMIPWWYRIQTARATYYHNAGLNGLGLIAALAGFGAACVVLVRHVRTPAAFNDRYWYPVLAAIALAVLVVQATRGRALWAGFWVALGLAVALAGAAIARLREKRRGWV